ncbi:MAG: hypothetical protein QME64_05005 [bacterium]|nr:hypothetical protein [bacterium]
MKTKTFLVSFIMGWVLSYASLTIADELSFQELVGARNDHTRVWEKV